jgi:hypothetical protein
MSQDGREYGISGQTVGFITIAVGFAIILAWFLTRNVNDGAVTHDWFVVIPIALLECGLYGVVLGAFGEMRGKQGSKWGTDPVYTMFWGSLIAVIGALWLIGMAYPNDLPVLIAGFFIWIGVAMMMITRKRDTRPRLW